MKSLTIEPSKLARTFTLIARHDTHYFLDHELPEFLESLGETPVVACRRYFSRLRSGEYIPKQSYSDAETDFVYLTIGQFSGPNVSFEELTFLEERVGEDYEHLAIKSGDLVVTRSGTVGVVHVFEPPDSKVYIPSHHLAILEIPDDSEHSREYLRLFLQTEFARAYFWAFASGKSQKEISNWSIKSIPIPQCVDPHAVAAACQSIEEEMRELEVEIQRKQDEKEGLLLDAIKGVAHDSD